ncbi:MAG: NADH-quinone oxidoreductase subunit C [Verrucomicrobiota bacterium]|jgi:NADH-quinone oxidoreductase subunit C|nr:NADH-quinone oxidoreductase subunit C [Verrucomicrobiota bacterium]|tara:strand:- start:745 stop:1320 length:576 start_codon:yes stop_codon:yes gene_type:complete
MNSSEAVEKIETRFQDNILLKNSFRDELSLTVTKDSLIEIMTFCKNDLGFDYLVDLTAVDNLGTNPRYEVVYELYSYSDSCHLRIKVGVDESEREVSSVVGLWPTANWHEREAFDMIGVTFSGHPDMRRILMWEGYPYYPLRKDFPLAGKTSDMPDVAFSEPVPLEGGPFVTSPSSATTDKREPRSREIPQ